MSRTDVHRPWRVQIADPHNRHLLYRYPTRHSTEVTSYRNIFCGCRLCTGHDERRARRRRDRHEARRVLRRSDLP